MEEEEDATTVVVVADALAAVVIVEEAAGKKIKTFLFLHDDQVRLRISKIFLRYHFWKVPR